MYTHTITRLAYKPIFIIMFVSGICLGSIFGLAFILMNRDSVGLFGGTFIALLAGLASGLVALIYTAVYNTLAPAIGGITLQIEQLPVASNTQPPDSLSH